MKRRRLGQHYLADEDIASEMVSSAEIGPSDVVLEIGTGKGVLTGALVDRAKSVIGYEIDPANAEATRSRVRSAKLHLRVADVFDESPRFDVLVSSLPYSRSADFVEWLSGMDYRRAVVLLQSDFARKLVSPAGSRDYRAVSAIAQIASVVELRTPVARGAFDPQPRVGSVLVVITPRRKLSRAEVDGVKSLFGLRKKTLGAASNSLGIGVPEGLDGSVRVFRIPPEEVYALVAGGRASS